MTAAHLIAAALAVALFAYLLYAMCKQEKF
jgi:K+-transporting ATPase KdpF subunit